jgi:hypothetical protein
MTACSRNMLDHVWTPNRGGKRDVYVDYQLLTFDITMTALFGQDLPDTELVRL